MEDPDEEMEDSIHDTSIDTETWDKLGLPAAGGAGGATQDTAVSLPPLARSLEVSFDEYGSFLAAATSVKEAQGAIPMVVDSLPGSSASPLVGGMDSGCVLNEGSEPTPSSGKRGSGGSGRQPKKTAGRKPAPKQASTPEMAAPASALVLGGDLGAALGTQNAGAKAKRSKATPVVSRAPSARAKAKLGDLSSMESAKLRMADKNLDATGNPLPHYKTLNAFSDDHLVRILDDSGVAVHISQHEVISLVRAREEAQAALAEAAARCAAGAAVPAPLVDPVGTGALDGSEEGEEDRDASTLPSSSRMPARKRVAKAVSSRGVRLRNRII